MTAPEASGVQAFYQIRPRRKVSLRRLALLCLLQSLALLSALPAQADDDFIYDQRQSQVRFELRHLGLITVSGHFAEFSGTFHFNPAWVELGEVNIAIQTASVTSANKTRDKSLRSKSFFWADKHPQILFKSRRFRKGPGAEFLIDGDLTIRGISRPVTFITRQYPVPAAEAASGRLYFKAHTEIKRSDFQLGTGNIFDPIMFITDETLRILLDVHGLPAGESN